MNSFGNFLWKLFSVTMIFLCHLGSSGAVAEESETPTQYVANDPKMTSTYFTSTDDVGSNYTRTLRLCSSGYYLSGCGSASLGTNWLKGMKSGDVTTPDYYSYDIDESDTLHMENLRKFFAHNEPITYRERTATSSGGYTYADTTVPASTYKIYLYQILSNFCTNKDGYISYDDIHCTKCPNNALVSRSTLSEDTYRTGKILWDSWDVHTIADCYMNEFSDEDGTYIYIADNVENNNDGVNCYYNKNVYGSTLYYK